MATSAKLVQDAETQLLEFLRGEDVSSSFSVTIVCGNDKCIVSTTDNDSGAYCIGQGPTFADAWHDRKNQILTAVRPRLKAGFLTKQSRPAIAVVLVYHDLRVANEGIDIEQIAAVFD